MKALWATIGSWLWMSTLLPGAEVPAEVLDLSTWKLTLPVDTARPGSPDEIRQPELKSFREPDWFFVDATGQGVVFRASCGADTTKGSKYPRSELREMSSPAGKSSAKWSTGDAVAHTLIANLAVTHTPEVKKQVVCAQIHDANDDLMMIRLEGKKLIVERNKLDDVLLDPNYELGRYFDLKVAATQGQVRVWYNDELKMDWKVLRDGCYFKAGCYTQSNLKRGDKPEAYGEVIIRRLNVSHVAE